MDNIFKVNHVKSGKIERLYTSELLEQFPEDLNEYLLRLEGISKVSIVDSSQGTVLIRKEA